MMIDIYMDGKSRVEALPGIRNRGLSAITSSVTTRKLLTATRCRCDSGITRKEMVHCGRRIRNSALRCNSAMILVIDGNGGRADSRSSG